MRLRDKNKQRHEESVANELLKELRMKPVAERPGDPSKSEPDRIYQIEKKTIGVEVVTAYYSEQEAKATAEAAAEKPIAPGEIRLGVVIGSPDDSVCESIQENLDAKCSKKYSGTDETWLCINVEAPLTELESLKECVDNLDVPENQFARIYVTVSKPEGGLEVFEVVASAGMVSKMSLTRLTKLHQTERGNGICSSEEDYLAVPPPTTRCEICGTPTKTSFGSPGNLHYYCKDHRDALFAQVTGRAPKKTPKPEK